MNESKLNPGEHARKIITTWPKWKQDISFLGKTTNNPHIEAQIELLKWEEEGIRNTFDPELAVMEDLYPSKFYPDRRDK